MNELCSSIEDTLYLSFSSSLLQCKMKLLKLNVECWRCGIVCVVFNMGTVSLTEETIIG